MIAASLGVFVLLYLVLGVVDFVLMPTYARVDPPPADPGLAVPAGASPASGYGAA